MTAPAFAMIMERLSFIMAGGLFIAGIVRGDSELHIMAAYWMLVAIYYRLDVVSKWLGGAR